MKKLYFLFSLFFSVFLNAQNYQTVYSNTESFYYTPSNNIYGIKPDSFQVSGTDTTFFHYRTVADTNNWSTQGYPNCAGIVLDYPTWQGVKTICKSNGQNIFFNLNNDSVFINTNAVPLQNWTMYKYPNGDLIKASLISCVNETINIFSDSVKTIQLSVTDALGNSVANDLNGKTIKLSKSKGWFVSFNWRDFPADTLCWTIEPAKRLQIKDYNTFNPGDVMCAEFEKSCPTNPPPGYCHTILSWQNYGNDSIVYDVAVRNNVWTPTGSFPPYVLSYTYDTIQIVVDSIFNYVFPLMPEQVDLPQLYINYKRGYKMTREQYGSCIKYGYYLKDDGEYQGTAADTCYNYAFEPVYSNNYAISGLGIFHHDSYTATGNCDDWTATSFYSSSCGNGIILGLEKYSSSRFLLFPNPAKNSLTIKFSSNENISDAVIFIQDISGREVPAGFIKKLTDEISVDVNSLSAGIYFLKIKAGGNSYVSKFIKED